MTRINTQFLRTHSRMFQAAAISFACASYQIVTIKLLARVFSLQGRMAVSSTAGMAVFGLGIGAALTPLLSRHSRLTSWAAGAAVVVGALAIPLQIRYPLPIMHKGLFAASLAAIAVGLVLMGACLGTVFAKTPMKEPTIAGRIVAAATAGSAIGFAAGPAITLVAGIWPLLFGIAACIMLYQRPLVSCVVAGVVVAGTSLAGLEKVMECGMAPMPVFWKNHQASEHTHLFGRWSPYARVDFYRMPGGCLAGTYNLAQQWMVCPGPERDFDLRRELYPVLKGHVLIIGSGGGQALLSLTKASEITAVELDPVVVRTLKGPLRDYNAEAYLRHNTIIADGRAFLDRTGEKFDAVILEGTDLTAARPRHAPIGYENYLYAKEGIRRAFHCLDETGVLIAAHTRAILPSKRVIHALPKEVAVSVWAGTAKGPIDFPCRIVLASRSTRTISELDSVFQRHLPQFKKERVPVEGDASQRPITDNRPFLYFTSWNQLHPLLSVGFGITVFLAGLIAFLRPMALGGYFAAIGVGYIMMYLCLLAVFRSAAGGISTTYGAVMTSFSIATCLGALIWQRLNRRFVLWLTVGGALWAFGLGWAVHELPALPWLRMALIALATLPPGLAMGTYMPAGFVRAGNNAAVCWGIDAAGTALGFVIFYAAALCGGFWLALFIALLFYATAWRLWDKAVMN